LLHFNFRSMDNTPDEFKSGNRLDTLSDARDPQDVYEISVDSCRYLIDWRDNRGRSIWYYKGMINSIKPMWALMLGSHKGFILGFIWNTKISLSQVTSQDVIGVRCEVWWTQTILESMDSEQQGLFKDSRNLLGRTVLSIWKIRDEGSSTTFKCKYSF
jgi:hypothetical protein